MQHPKQKTQSYYNLTLKCYDMNSAVLYSLEVIHQIDQKRREALFLILIPSDFQGLQERENGEVSIEVHKVSMMQND